MIGIFNIHFHIGNIFFCRGRGTGRGRGTCERVASRGWACATNGNQEQENTDREGMLMVF